MDASFWHKKWESNEIGFHESEANPMLVNYVKELSLQNNAKIFLPLCGKTRDIAWLLSMGYQVAGAELSEIAIEQLFAELDITPKIAQLGQLIHFSAENIDIFVGDIFDLSSETLGQIGAIYDRAALVALPEDVRKRYTSHLIDITGKAPQLLLCFEYDQSLMAGPPFSINEQEVRQHYKSSYDISLLKSINIPGGLKGQSDAEEHLWLLR